ncbi:Uncharacterized zinc protease y4wA [Geodia barretti]|uniref:Uncharacterized zinc protease y4wA n=1 Tax=Geodia barretti TaxID=519541 RepID=A0AA35RA18_GEOBA|nr:Uncharacterized zinc protease y4wA [Geodia barretti]
MIPASTLERMGIAPARSRRLRIANGERVEYQTALAYFETGGFEGEARVVFGPEGLYLLGATALEDMLLVVDPIGKRLVPEEALLMKFVDGHHRLRAAQALQRYGRHPHEDHTIPLVAVNVWYHVGSKNEEMGRTGFAHLFEHVIPNYLELALWLEADRRGFLLDGLDQQKFDLQDEDLTRSLDDVKNFFQRFYGPSNASLAIAGDFRADEALELVNGYFGDLPPGESVPRIERQDSLLSGRVDIEMRDKVTLPRLYIAWPAPPEGHPDDAPLELYQAVMSDGLSSRLHRSLVYEKQIAQHAFIRYVPSEIAGQLLVQVTAAEGHSLDEFARIGGFGGRADQLNHFNIIESNRWMYQHQLRRTLAYAVAARGYPAVAQAYVGDNRVRLRVLPDTPLSAASTTIDRNIMPPPSKEPAFTPPLPTRDRLPNGMGVTVVEQRGMPIVAFGVLLGTGASADPADLPGLAGLVGDMLPEGAAGKPSQQIANEFEFIGARLSVDSRREYSLLSTETLAKHWGSALEMMGEVMLSPDFPQHELDRVRREQPFHLFLSP